MCRPATWKREVVPDHKFDFIDVRDYHDTGIGTRLKYFWVYVLVIKSFLVYCADIYTAVTMLSTSTWSNTITGQCTYSYCPKVPPDVNKWLLIGCIGFSFLLLAYESRKAKKIVASRDISFAYTNSLASDYYSIRSYDHFCFFTNIENSTKRMDDFAFFIFFTFKEWKRLILADGPRAVLNGITLTALFIAKNNDPKNKLDWYDLNKYFSLKDLSTSAIIGTMVFTVLIFAGSLILLIIAGICYVPLLCHIQGNLKEYCCHKVDKRIDELVERKNKQRRAALAKKQAAGDLGPRKGKKDPSGRADLPEPTLPNLSVDDDFDDSKSTRPLRFGGGGAAPSLNYASSINTDPYYHDKYEYAAEYPPMPMYDNVPYQNGYGGPDQYQADAYGHEYARATPAPTFVSQAPYQGSYATDPRDAYSGGNQYGNQGAVGGPQQRQNSIDPNQPAADPNARRRSSGLAYDDYDEPQQQAPPSRHGTPAAAAYPQQGNYAPPRHGTPAGGYQQQENFAPPSRHGTPAAYQQQQQGGYNQGYAR